MVMHDANSSPRKQSGSSTGEDLTRIIIQPVPKHTVKARTDLTVPKAVSGGNDEIEQNWPLPPGYNTYASSLYIGESDASTPRDPYGEKIGSNMKANNRSTVPWKVNLDPIPEAHHVGSSVVPPLPNTQ